MKRNKRLRRKRELEKLGEGFLGGSVVKYLPAIAGDTGLISGLGTKIPRVTEQLSPCATATGAHRKPPQ